MKAGKRIFAWHHWCGLLVGLFLLMMSTSGSLLVFAEELEEKAISPYLKTENPTGSFSTDKSLSVIRERWPGWEIRLYDEPGKNEALIYELRRDTECKKIFVHPQSGAILHVNENANTELQRWLLLLHYTLHAGTAGKVTVFIIGILFVITLFTGVWVYRKSFVNVLKFRVRVNKLSTRGRYSSLHRIIGVWSLVFNLLLVITGLVLSYQVATNALKLPKPVYTDAVPPVKSIDEVRMYLKTYEADFNIHLVRIRANANAIQVLGRYDSDPGWYGKYYSGFVFNGETLAVESKFAMQDMPLSQRLLRMCGPLHFGNYGGLWLKILYSFLGLAPGFLSVSGFIIWMKKKKVKK